MEDLFGEETVWSLIGGFITFRGTTIWEQPHGVPVLEIQATGISGVGITMNDHQVPLGNREGG